MIIFFEIMPNQSCSFDWNLFSRFISYKKDSTHIGYFRESQHLTSVNRLIVLLIPHEYCFRCSREVPKKRKCILILVYELDKTVVFVCRSDVFSVLHGGAVWGNVGVREGMVGMAFLSAGVCMC